MATELITAQDVADSANEAGLSREYLTNSFGLLKALIDAGFGDPGPFTRVLATFKLQNDKWLLGQQAAQLTADQQQKVNDLIASTNPAIGEKNQQIAAIDEQLKQLQG